MVPLLTLLFEQTSSMPVQLGPLGTLFMTLLAIALAGLNAYQWRKSGEALHWRGAAQAFESELGIVRERCQRLETANSDQGKEIATLRGKTDLESLKTQTTDMQRMIVEHVHRVSERHEAMLAGLKELTQTVSDMHQRFLERDEEYAELIRAQSTLIKSLQSQLGLRDAMKK